MPDSRFFGRPVSFPLSRLAEIGGCVLAEARFAFRAISGVATPETAGSGDLTFFSNARYRSALAETKAGACVIDGRNARLLPEDTAALLSDNPYCAYAKIAAALFPGEEEEGGVHPTAVVAKDARVGRNVRVGAYSIVERGAEIGDGSRIGSHCLIGASVAVGRRADIRSHVTLTHCIVGDGVEILPGARVGQEGFGFATEKGAHVSVPQLGIVRIGNFVHIGANVTIDRGSLRDTVVEDGVRIDNLVQIGHNVRIGKGAVIVAQVGIAGSSEIGPYAALGGQSGVAGHLRVGAMASVAAQSGVATDVPDKAAYGGAPAMPIRQWHRMNALLKQSLTKNKDKE
jgi:UDP-3-O-[3-hydroxymyristoyl] glucosamine N-acyltransferase